MSNEEKVLSIEERVAARIALEYLQDKENRKGAGGVDEGLGSQFVLNCLNANELGDGILYATVNNGKYVYDLLSGEWFVWGGHYWIKDLRAGSAKGAVEKICEVYLLEAGEAMARIHKANLEGNGKSSAATADEEQRKALYSRVKRLRGSKGRIHCLEFATHNSARSLAVNGEVFDKNIWAFACQNGVLDLRTGELKPGSPEDYITVASPIKWEGLNCPSPIWENFLNEIHAGDVELIAFIQRLMGFAMTGSSEEHIMPFLWGQGRNGKSTFVETIKDIMGPMASPIPSETLLENGNPPSPNAPDAVAMALRGLRMAFASETDQNRKISTARVKSLTGGESLSARSPHDKYFTKFKTSHTLFLQTNEKPSAPADDYAFWQRMLLIPYTLSFVVDPTAPNERKRDEHLPEKLKKELPGILSWMARGCLEWQRIGLCPPARVTDATAEYRHEEDVLGQWLDEFAILDSTSFVKASELYSEFNEWFKENQNSRGISQTRFGKLATKRFNKQKTGGTYRYFGLRLAGSA